MRKLGKAQKMGITCAILCCALLAIVFSADYKKLFASVTDALNALTGTEATMTVDSMVVMNTEDAQQTDDYYAFGVYAPSAATYTIGVTAENGKMRINTGEAIAVDGTEVSVSLTEGTNVLYFVDCENPSIQWNSENCDLEPVNKVCMPLSGDVNQSGNRTVEDLVRIKKEAQEAGSGNIERTAIADIDGSDSITDDDASLLRTLMVGNPGYEVAERHGLIVDAYIEETGILYDTLAEAVEAASAISVSDSKSVTVTVLNPTDVKLTAQIPVQGGAQIILQDDGTKDSGWSRTITRGSEEAFKMFTVADATLTLTGSSGSDEYSSLILDGGAIANAKNHIVDVGWTPSTAKSGTLTMNAGVKLTNNINSGSNSGGGALAIRYTFNMNGGVISGNINAGNSGAINLGTSGTTMNMTGGIITENETRTDMYSAGGVNISNGATLIMTGGEIYGNIAPDSVGGNSVRKSSETSTLQMGGSAYIDRVCFDSTSVDTHCLELTSKLTTDKKITLFFTQPLNEANAVIKRDSSCAENDSLFVLSERMLPCKLVQDDSNENLCLRSDITEMDHVAAVQKVYSSGNLSDEIDNTWVVQGVCSDGQYLYMAITKDDSSGCRILRVNLGTWDDSVLGATIPTDHSNEMTYNPTTKKIYITHCISTGLGNTTDKQGPYTISVVDPSNVNTVEDTIELPVAETYTGKKGISALAYNATQQYYVAGGTGFRFGFLKDDKDDNDNDTITECAMPDTGLSGFTGYTAYTKQGIYATDTTIYANTWYDIINVQNEEMNFITMYDWSGNYNGSKCVVQADGTTPFTQEIESMFEYNEKMYMACIPEDHTGVEIYELSDVGTAQSTIDVKDSTGTVVDGVYTNLADAIAKANELGIATIVLKEDVTIVATQTITGNVTITDDGTKRTLQRSTGCTEEMFNVAGGAELTFTSSSMDDKNPMLVIDGNKANVTTANYAPVVHMNQTNGILNITPGVIVQNNKSHNAGGIIIAGANKSTSSGGGLATINITGGLFTGNEVASSSQYLFGGCIYIENGCTLNISNATFEDTVMATTHAKGQTYGGVISVRTNKNQQHNADGASVTLENCIFKNTTVTQSDVVNKNGGSVLYIGDGNPSSVQVTNCEFTNNVTEGLGGAIYMANTTTSFGLSGCSFSNNTDANGTNDIYMVASTNINVSGDTQANIYCAGQKQIHIAEIFGTESVIKVTVPDTATAGITVATFASEDIMTACKENRNIVLSESSYALSYDATNLNATLVDAVAVVEDSGYASLAEAIDVASTMTSDADNPVVIKLISDTVAINGVMTIPTGTFVEIIDDGTQRTLQRTDGCTNEMFNVEGEAGLTFTSSSKDDSNPMLVIDGNKANVEIPDKEYAPVVKMNQTNGILNITPGVIVQNNKSKNTGGVIYAGANKTTGGGGLATINITGGLFTENEVEYSSSYLFGGCIYIEAGCTLNISNATFENTTMKASGGTVYGGVISVRTHANQDNATEGADVTLNNCIFKNTSVSQTGTAYGGGVLYIGASNNGNVEITSCEFKENSTEGVGGAIDMRNSNTTLVLYGCRFSDNTDKTGINDIYMVKSTNVNVSGNTQVNIHCAGTEQIHIAETLGTESVLRVTMSSATTGATVTTFESEDIMTACKENKNIVLSDASYALSYDATKLNATLVDAVAVVEDSGYASLADAIAAATTMESDAENPEVITLISDMVAINGVMTIPTGTFVEIIDDGTQRTLQRTDGCTNEMFNVEGGAGLTFTSSSKDDSNPMLVIDGNKANVEIKSAAYAPVVDMNQTNGILNITPGVVVQNNKSKNTGGVIFAGLNGTTNKSGSQATINITGGLFMGNEVEYSASKYLFGGCIYIESGCTLNISNATFENTTMTQNCTGGMTYGGVISVRTNASYLYDGANVTLENCTFKNTSVTQKGSGNGGGVLYIGGGNSGSVQITNCEFTGNTTDGLGGAIHTINTDVAFELTGCSFSNNTDATGTNDIYMVKSTNVNISGNTQANIKCAGTEQIHITETLGTESVIQVSVSNATAGATVATFASEEIMNACQTNENLVLTNSAYTLIYETTSESNYIAKLSVVE